MAAAPPALASSRVYCARAFLTYTAHARILRRPKGSHPSNAPVRRPRPPTRWAVRIAQTPPTELPEAPEPPPLAAFKAATAAAAACAPGGEAPAAMFCLDPDWDYLNHGSYGATFKCAPARRQLLLSAPPPPGASCCPAPRSAPWACRRAALSPLYNTQRTPAPAHRARPAEAPRRPTARAAPTALAAPAARRPLCAGSRWRCRTGTGGRWSGTRSCSWRPPRWMVGALAARSRLFAHVQTCTLTCTCKCARTRTRTVAPPPHTPWQGAT